VRNTGSHNSCVEVYLETTAHLVGCDPLCVERPKDVLRDIETIKFRYREEGLSFLTKALPALGKAIDRGLVNGRFSLPRGWKHSHVERSRPAFMQAYFNRVFGDGGVLRDEADPFAVRHLRQVCFAMYKLEVPYQQKEETHVIESFIRTDSSLQLNLDDEDVLSVVERASHIAGDILRSFDPKDILPRHGPGAVATGERGDDKWRFSRLYNRIHQQFPYYEYFVVGGARELADRLDWYRTLQRHESGTAKVVLVPKDSRGPRLISCEPLEYQWIQQGVGRKLMSHLEAHQLTSGRVNFTHQTINQELAMRSSIDDSMATLDMKDASDRVSLELVKNVFQYVPKFLAAIEACRTTATQLPDGRVVTLKKFAPMGSALCFPVEALVFWVICVASVIDKIYNGASSPSLVGKHVFVYGDDIIVPKEWAHVCIQALESVGLLVNRDKSCITGPFKESCGVDAFKGILVTPIRLRTLWTGQRSDGAAYASYVSFANQIRKRGYTGAYEYIRKAVESTYGLVPYGTTQAAYPCWLVSDPLSAIRLNVERFKSRYNSNYQRVEFLVPRISSRYVDTQLDSWPRLLRDQVSGELLEPSRIVVPRSIRIKRGWTPVF